MQVIYRMHQERWMRNRFLDCGLTGRTTKALMAAGHTSPEQLLVRPIAEIRQIRGIGALSLKEIEAYRTTATCC